MKAVLRGRHCPWEGYKIVSYKSINIHIIGASSGQPVSASSAVQASVVSGLSGGVKRQRSPSPPRTCSSGQTISVGLPTR